MSASREKKNRQELAAQGHVDPRVEREQKEAAERKKNKLIYGGVAVLFVIVAAVVLLYNSGIFQRGATAVTVDGKNFTAAEVDYFYYNALNNVRNSSYSSYMGLDSSSSMKSQNLNAMAKMLLGVTSEEDMTWDAFLKDTAKKNLAQSYLLSEKAKAEGATFDDHMQEELQADIDSITTYAKQQGYTFAAYLKLVYGSNMTVSTFKEMYEMTALASHYQEEYVDSLSYTDDELEACYEADKNSFDVADYEYISFKATADSTKDADGNTRELHTELAKGAIDYTVLPDYRTHYQKAQDREVELVSCPYFTTSLYDLTEAQTIDYSALDSFVVVICVEGKGTLCDDSGNEMPIHQGETVLLPATVKSLRVIPGGNLKMLTSYIK